MNLLHDLSEVLPLGWSMHPLTLSRLPEVGDILKQESPLEIEASSSLFSNGVAFVHSRFDLTSWRMILEKIVILKMLHVGKDSTGVSMEVYERSFEPSPAADSSAAAAGTAAAAAAIDLEPFRVGTKLLQTAPDLLDLLGIPHSDKTKSAEEKSGRETEEASECKAETPLQHPEATADILRGPPDADFLPFPRRNSLACDICQKDFVNRKALVRHAKRHLSPQEKPHKCRFCEKTFAEKSNLVVHERGHTGDRPFRCIHETCDRSFASRASLIEHRRGHVGEKPFRCDICGKSFISKKRLKRHAETVHAGVKMYECHVCRKSFKDRYALRPHMKIHCGEKDFKCEKCPKSFVQRIHLDNHIRSHTGERPYLCEICSKSFRSSSNLCIHMRCHKSTKRFACPLCPQTFAQRGDLVTHKRIHTDDRPFACRLCPKRYTKKSSLDQHLLSHEDTLPFLCHLCDKAFARKNDLKRHSVVHSGLKPFKCERCSKMFMRRIFLTRHEAICGKSVTEEPKQNELVSLPQPSKHCQRIISIEASSYPHAQILKFGGAAEDAKSLTVPLPKGHAAATVILPSGATLYHLPSGGIAIAEDSKVGVGELSLVTLGDVGASPTTEMASHAALMGDGLQIPASTIYIPLLETQNGQYS